MKRTAFLLLFISAWFLADAGIMNSALAAQKAGDQTSNYEIVFWESVKDSNNIDMYKAYIKKYPNGVFAELARIKIKSLQKNVSKTPSKSSKKTTSPPALKEKNTAKPSGTKSQAKGQSKASLRHAVLKLRATPKKLEEEDVVKMLRRYNFFDYEHNYEGKFKNRLKDNGDGTLTDRATGLVWEKTGSWRRSIRKNADWYVDDLNYRKVAGRTDWRLPTVEELASLLQAQYTEMEYYHIDPMFGDENGDWVDRCWTADTLRTDSGADEAAWVVNFKRGGVKPAYWVNESIGSFTPQYEKNYVRAVYSKK